MSTLPPITIPGNCPPKVSLNKGDTLTINFDQTVFLWNTDPDEFVPQLEIRVYNNGETWAGQAQTKSDDTIEYGWLAFVADSEKYPVRQAKTKSLDQGSGGHVIIVGSGGILDVPQLKKDLKSDKDLCACWPCSAKLINFLIKKPLPKEVRNFLEVLLKAGNAICPVK